MLLLSSVSKGILDWGWVFRFRGDLGDSKQDVMTLECFALMEHAQAWQGGEDFSCSGQRKPQEAECRLTICHPLQSPSDLHSIYGFGYSGMCCH